MLLWTSFLLAFSTLLPLINPLGSSLIFLGLVGEAPAEIFRSLALRIAINNIIFLLIVEVLGSAILRFFGISLPIVQVSGGLVIAALGWSMLNQRNAQASAQQKQDEAQAFSAAATRGLEQKAFYPFTFPITSGPGTIVVTLTLSAHEARTAITANILSHLGLFLAIVLLSFLVYLCYAYAPKLAKSVSPSTIQGIQQVMAFIVLSIGIQIAWNGASALLSQLPRP